MTTMRRHNLSVRSCGTRPRQRPFIVSAAPAVVRSYSYCSNRSSAPTAAAWLAKDWHPQSAATSLSYNVLQQQQQQQQSRRIILGRQRRHNSTQSSCSTTTLPTVVVDDDDKNKNTAKNEELSPKIPKPIIVVLLGWVGAQPQQLAKYEALYDPTSPTENKTNDLDVVGNHNGGSIEFVSHIAPTPTVILLNQQWMEQSARHVLTQVATILKNYQHQQPQQQPLSETKIPIVFHAFSNGGGLILHTIEEMLLKRTNTTTTQTKDGDSQEDNGDVTYIQQHAGIVAQIWDSAPAYPDSPAFLQLVEQVMAQQPKVVQWVAQEVAKVSYHIYSWWHGGPKQHRGFTWYWNGRMRLTCDNRNSFPTLYIYSQSDAITQAEKLEELIAARQKTTPTTILQVCKFEDSQHVLHYRKYPKEYQAAVDNFMDTILALK